MFKGIFLSVMALILVMLGILEIVHNQKQEAEGWEAKYYKKRLKRRLALLALLMPVILTLLYMDQLRLLFHGPWWSLTYMTASLALILVVVILAALDALETIRYAVYKHAEITSHSIKGMQDRFQKKSSDTDDIEPEGNKS